MPLDRKEEIVTFKADRALVKAMRGLHNRSDFIRAAILAALDGTCPLCGGSGILTPHQRKHWEAFQAQHRIEECHKCHATHLTCSASTEKTSCAPGNAARRGTIEAPEVNR